MEKNLLNIDQALHNYRHLPKKNPKFGMEVLANNFKAGPIVILENDGVKRVGAPVRYNFYVMILCLSGGSKRWVNQHEYTIKQHSLQLLPPTTIQHFEDTHDISEYYVMLFEKEFLSYFDHILNFHNDNFDDVILSPNIFHKVKDLYEEIDLEFKNNSLDHMCYIELLLKKLLLILKREKIKVSTTNIIQNKADIISTKFLCLIEKNFINKRSVKDYAYMLGISSKHLSETIKEKLGKSALYYIHQRTIKEAKYLLAHTQMHIHEIATLLNFQDSSQFSRFFKQHESHSPKNYRIKFQINH